METGLVLPVPAADPLVGDIRRRFDPNAGLGVPAHVTLIHPFRPWETLDSKALACLGDIFRRAPPFELAFASVGRFPGVCWLEPEPRAPVDALVRVLNQAFPDCPPYGGRFADPVPHLTVAALQDEARLDSIQAKLERRLARPLRVRVETCALFIRTDEGWIERLRFPLG